MNNRDPLGTLCLVLAVALCANEGAYLGMLPVEDGLQYARYRQAMAKTFATDGGEEAEGMNSTEATCRSCNMRLGCTTDPCRYHVNGLCAACEDKRRKADDAKKFPRQWIGEWAPIGGAK